MTLYADRSLDSVLRADGNQAAFGLLDETMARLPWAVYRVRRVYTRKGGAERSVQKVGTGTRDEMAAALERLATYHRGTTEFSGGSRRLYVSRREPNVYPTTEEMYVAAPALADEKQKKNFEDAWRRVSLITV